MLTESPEFFRQLEGSPWPSLRRDFGDRPVEFQAGRSHEPDYEVKSASLRTRAALGEFLDRIGADTGNDVYLTANNARSNRELMDDLLREKRGPANLCGPDWDPSQVFLWLGPAGSVTPLHHDLTNNALAQIFGRKLVRLDVALPDRKHSTTAVIATPRWIRPPSTCRNTRISPRSTCKPSS